MLRTESLATFRASHLKLLNIIGTHRATAYIILLFIFIKFSSNLCFISSCTHPIIHVPLHVFVKATLSGLILIETEYFSIDDKAALTEFHVQVIDCY